MKQVYFPPVKAGRGIHTETEPKLITLPKSALEPISEVCKGSFGGNFSLYIRELLLADLKKRGFTVIENLST